MKVNCSIFLYVTYQGIINTQGLVSACYKQYQHSNVCPFCFQDELMYVSLANSSVSDIFYLTESGNIHLVKDLSDLRQIMYYTFNVQARDNRLVNPQSATITVEITVRPLQGPPNLNPVEITIPISQALNISFYTLSAFDADMRVSLIR